MRNIWNNRLPWIIAFPRIIAPFWCENINNRPWLLFEEIRYPNITVLIVRRGLGHNIQGIAKSQELRKTLWQCRNIDFASVSRFMSTSVRIGNNIFTRLQVIFICFLFFLLFSRSLASSCQILSPNASRKSHRWPLNTCIWKSAHIGVSAEPDAL